MKMWICRDNEGLAAFHNMPVKIYGNPNDETDYWWAASDRNEPIILNPSEYPEVTFENSPKEVELKVKHNGMRLSPMFRLLDMIVIKDPSDRKRIVAYTKKLIDKLKEEGFDADARVAEGYLKMFNGESMAMATMDEVELKLKK